MPENFGGMKVNNKKSRNYRTDRFGLVRRDHMPSAIEQGICHIPFLVDDSGEFTVRIGERRTGACSEATDAPKSCVLDSHCTSVRHRSWSSFWTQNKTRTFCSTMSYQSVVVSGIKYHWYVVRKVGKKELGFRAWKMRDLRKTEHEGFHRNSLGSPHPLYCIEYVELNGYLIAHAQVLFGAWNAACTAGSKVI